MSAVDPTRPAARLERRGCNLHAPQEGSIVPGNSTTAINDEPLSDLGSSKRELDKPESKRYLVVSM
jgi:hypothetical protein